MGKSLNSHCPQCEIEVPRVPNRKELSELAEEIRYMMIKAEKISYWRQFEQGMLSRDAVRVLINLADTVLDTPDRFVQLEHNPASNSTCYTPPPLWKSI